MPITIDSDIRKAKTLPSSYYTNPKIFSELRKRFANHLHFAGHQSQLDDQTAIPIQHMGELIGEPMIMTRSDRIRCISNVCTHRGMLVCSTECSAKSLKCPYHGRTFGLDGTFRSMPRFDNVSDFPSPEDNLKEFVTESWKGLIFSGVGNSSSEGNFQELRKRLEWIPIESFKNDPSRNRSYEIDANWLLYVDNYLEGFHIPYVHSDLNNALDYDSYRTELFEGGTLQIGIASEGEPSFDLPESSPDFGLRVAAYYYWLFPGTMLNFYPWGLSVNLVIPLSVNRTKIIYHGYVGDPLMLGRGAGGNLDKVELEDQEIVEATQSGVESGSYDRGRYSPTMETGIHHFHRILTRTDD